MVNNSSLTVSCDRGHLNFIHLSNLYNAHKFKKVQTRCTIERIDVGLKGQGAAASLHRELNIELIFGAIYVKHLWFTDRVTVSTGNVSSQYNLCINMSTYVQIRPFLQVNVSKSFFHWQKCWDWLKSVFFLHPFDWRTRLLFATCTSQCWVQWCAGEAVPQRGRLAG